MNNLSAITCAVLFGLGLTFGCGGSDGGGEMGDPSSLFETRVPRSCEAGGESALFLTSRFKLGAATEGEDQNVVPGMNLDGLVSDLDDVAGCKKRDFVSPDAIEGVDNQMGALIGLAGVDLDGSIGEAIQTGDFLLAIEVSGIDDWASDDCVGLTVYEAGLPAGVESLVMAGDVIAPNQSVVIDEESGNTTTGRIRSGQLQGDLVDFSMTVPVGTLVGDASTALPLDVKRGIFDFDLNATGLSNGLIGGALRVQDAITSIAAIGIGEDTVRPLIEGQADLSPNSMGVCQELSVGMVFEAVPAMASGSM